MGLLLDVNLAVPSPEDVQAFVRRDPSYSEQITPSNVRKIACLFESPQRADWIEQGDRRAGMIVSAFRSEGHIEPEEFFEWWILQNSFEKLNSFLEKEFPGYELLERHESQLKYKLPQDSLARIFGLFESMKGSLGVSHFSASQASLETIFNTFASQEHDSLQ